MNSILTILHEFQGIIGVLAGISGGYFLKSLGKTHITLENCNFKYVKVESDGEGGFIEKEINPNSNEEVCCYYSMYIEIYNGSETPRVLKNIKIKFIKKNRIIQETIPNDDIKRIYKSHITEEKELKVINIPAKQIVNLNISGSCKLNKCHDKVQFTAIQNKSTKISKTIKKL